MVGNNNKKHHTGRASRLKPTFCDSPQFDFYTSAVFVELNTILLLYSYDGVIRAELY